MKAQQYIIICLVLFGACKNKANNIILVAPPNISTTSPAVISGVAFERSKMAGKWVSEAYLADVKAKKSVYAVESPTILAFNLFEQELQTDSATNLDAYNYAGDNLKAPLKWDDEKSVFRLDTSRYDSNNAKFYAPDFELKYYPLGKIEISQNQQTQTFVRCQDVEQGIHKALFVSEYTNLKGDTIRLAENERCYGFKNYHFYTVTLPFDYETDFGFDAICFNQSLKHSTCYHYKFRDANTVDIFEILTVARYKYEIGKLVDTWTKK